MKKYLIGLILGFSFLSPIYHSSYNTTIKFLSNFIKPGDLVFDVGANVGLKSKLYLDLGAKVVGVEPQPACCEKLLKRFISRDFILEKIGLSDKKGELVLYLSDATTLATFSQEWIEKSRFTKAGYKWQDSVRVPVDVLDSLITKYGLPKFCKIDVENHELNVLKGLSTPIPVLSFEYALETLDNTYLCLEYLESIGYRKFAYAVGEEAKIVSDWISKDELIKHILNFSKNKFIPVSENDFIWGDIYAIYP